MNRNDSTSNDMYHVDNIYTTYFINRQNKLKSVVEDVLKKERKKVYEINVNEYEHDVISSTLKHFEGLGWKGFIINYITIPIACQTRWHMILWNSKILDRSEISISINFNRENPGVAEFTQMIESKGGKILKATVGFSFVYMTNQIKYEISL